MQEDFNIVFQIKSVNLVVFGKDSKIDSDHPFTRSIDTAYLQH